MHHLKRAFVGVSLASMIAAQIAAAQAATTAPSPLRFSGVIFGNWQNHSDSASRAAHGGKAFNKFDVDRVYLNFIMPAGDRATIRATTDVFQNATTGYYGGWTVRLKYAWLQYDLATADSANDWSAFAKVGLLTTPITEFEESYWPRWLAQTAPDRNALFSPSDAGLGAQLTLPNRLGSLYGTVTNGSGYAGAESDRFKDFAVRLSLTPWGKSKSSLSTLSLSPWIWRGEKASQFANGGIGQVGPVTDGLDRNRWGVLAAIRDPRITAAAEYARRIDGTESGANTIASPDVIADLTGDLTDGYVVLRPAAWIHQDKPAPFEVVLRYDRVRLNTSTRASNDFAIAGLFYDLTAKTSVSLDYQTQTPRNGSLTPASKVLYMHWVANF
jgi:hypothetical protein